ncbi:ABC transporter permease [Streptomyces violaceorubidus]
MKDDQIALDEESAGKGEYKVGYWVRVATNGPVREYTLSGVFTTEDGAVNAGGSLVLFYTAVAQKQYLQPGYFEDATVTAAPGADDAKILAAVEPLLPDTAEAQTGQALADEQADQIEKGLGNLKQVLLGFAGIALFVGVFLISNTFTMLVAQRTKEIALMRAVGASAGRSPARCSPRPRWWVWWPPRSASPSASVWPSDCAPAWPRPT